MILELVSISVKIKGGWVIQAVKLGLSAFLSAVSFPGQCLIYEEI